MQNSVAAAALAILFAAPGQTPEKAAEHHAAATSPPRYVAPPPPRPAKPMPDVIPPYSELAAEVRAEMPDLDLSMIRYDENPEQRFVILNGRRITEGLPAGRDLWIHEIRPKAVVMRYIDRYFLLRPGG